jgi:hypothetical protein
MGHDGLMTTTSRSRIHGRGGAGGDLGRIISSEASDPRARGCWEREASVGSVCAGVLVARPIHKLLPGRRIHWRWGAGSGRGGAG